MKLRDYSPLALLNKGIKYVQNDPMFREKFPLKEHLDHMRQGLQVRTNPRDQYLQVGIWIDTALKIIKDSKKQERLSELKEYAHN